MPRFERAPKPPARGGLLTQRSSQTPPPITSKNDVGKPSASKEAVAVPLPPKNAPKGPSACKGVEAPLLPKRKTLAEKMAEVRAKPEFIALMARIQRDEPLYLKKIGEEESASPLTPMTTAEIISKPKTTIGAVKEMSAGSSTSVAKKPKRKKIRGNSPILFSESEDDLQDSGTTDSSEDETMAAQEIRKKTSPLHGIRVGSMGPEGVPYRRKVTTTGLKMTAEDDLSQCDEDTIMPPKDEMRDPVSGKLKPISSMNVDEFKKVNVHPDLKLMAEFLEVRFERIIEVMTMLGKTTDHNMALTTKFVTYLERLMDANEKQTRQIDGLEREVAVLKEELKMKRETRGHGLDPEKLQPAEPKKTTEEGQSAEPMANRGPRHRGEKPLVRQVLERNLGKQVECDKVEPMDIDEMVENEKGVDAMKRAEAPMIISSLDSLRFSQHADILEVENSVVGSKDDREDRKKDLQKSRNRRRRTRSKQNDTERSMNRTI